jgi:hypothetical protein
MKKAHGTPGECPDEPLNHGEHWGIKFLQSAHHERHADMPGADVLRCNEYKTGVVGDTRLSRFYLN